MKFLIFYSLQHFWSILGRYAKEEDIDVEGIQNIGEDSGWKQVSEDDRDGIFFILDFFFSYLSKQSALFRFTVVFPKDYMFTIYPWLLPVCRLHRFTVMCFELLKVLCFLAPWLALGGSYCYSYWPLSFMLWPVWDRHNSWEIVY